MGAEEQPPRQVFRPAPPLMSLACAFCVVTLALVRAAFNALTRHLEPPPNAWPFAIFALVLVVPGAVGAAILFRRIETDALGLTSASFLGKRRCAWQDIRRIDIRRGSFVIESAVGPVSAAMINPSDRDRLLRLVVEQAKLTRDLSDLPFGIEARYIPRAQEIAFTDFVPHNKRSH